MTPPTPSPALDARGIARPFAESRRRPRDADRQPPAAGRRSAADDDRGPPNRPTGASPLRSDDGGRSGDAGSPASARESVDPGWLPTDDLLADRPDRQVLVVGETVVGLTLTLLLGRAGYDPVLVGVRDRPWRSRVTYLPPPVRRVFDGIGVGERVRDRSVAVERVAVHGGDADSETGTVLSAAERTAPAPAVVRTRALRSVLEQRVSERRRRPERPIESLSQRDGGVTVRFDDGITERFDVVVDTSGSAALRPGDGAAPERVRLAQFEVPLDDGASRSRLRDRWHPNAVVQYSPRRGDPGTLLRITAPVRAVPSLLSGAEPAESSLADALADALGGPTRWSAGADLRAVTQVRLPRGPIRAAWWGVGAVSFCGRAACPVAPATGLDLALGVEDALAFVRALSERRRAASAAVEAYTTARRRRLTALRQTVATARATGEPPLSRPPTSSLGSLDVFRHAALGPFLGEPLWSLHRSGVR